MNIFKRILSHRKNIRAQQVNEIVGRLQEQNAAMIETITKLLEDHDAYVHKVEENITQQFEAMVSTTDARIWKAEENIIQQLASVVSTMDARVWKAEENIVQQLASVVSTMDARVWKAEENLGPALHEHIREARQRLMEKADLQNKILNKFDLEYTEKSYHKNLVSYNSNEKIRIIFLFQIASFWPSWESFYEECIKNENLDVKLVLLSDVVKETVQIQTARDFLKDKGIPFIDFEELNIDLYRPHIVVYQTPFDMLHRKYQNWSRNIKARGIRIVYIPYGIEIGDTAKARYEQFSNDLVMNAWRVFTLSEKMIEEYRKYSSNPNVVRSVGIPKFDGLFHKEKYQLPNNISLKVNRRKICLWKVHFPNRIETSAGEVQITPYLKEYLTFAERLKEFPDLFFIFMPHPKFLEACQWIGATEEAAELFNAIIMSGNAFIFNGDDYRPALSNADFVITDRSAIMVEAGALNVPILCMYNSDYQEPMTQAISPLYESYYHGTNCADMIDFLDMCKQGKDYKRQERNKAFHECVPYYDGKCGRRIMQCIIQDIKQEVKGDA